MEREIELELDRSEYVKERINSMKSLRVPTITEARSNLGLPLAEVVFVQCDNTLKEDFGLTPLKGAGDELWVSPSDLLIGKVALTPPLTSKHIQALTHEGILEIGYEIEKKFLNEMRMHEENYFEVKKKHILEQVDEVFRIEARSIELRERQACQNQQEKMIEEFNCILLEELNNLEEKLRREQEEVLHNRKVMLDGEWEQKLKDAINETVKRMTVQFLEEVERQNSILINNFKLEIQKARLEKGYAINLERMKCQECFRQLKHNLECKNIANMMYVLCMERRKCCEEKNAIEQYYLRETNKLNRTISEKDSKIKKLRKEKNKQTKEAQLRETCLLEILKQFQKFINFALRAAPTQAEFLLSVEKMMAFELTDAVLKSNYLRLKYCNEILPWQDQSRPSTTPVDGLEIGDHHNCFKEMSPREKEDDKAVAHLPAFYFKDKLYIREDFRNMISQGVEITNSSELWSKDVEMLIHTLRKSVSHRLEPERTQSLEMPEHDSKPYIEEFEENRHKCKAASSVQFVEYQGSTDKPGKVSIEDTRSQGTKLSVEPRMSLKPVFNSLNNINFDQIGKMEKKATILAATNSLELIMKRVSVRIQKETKYPEEDEDDACEIATEKCDEFVDGSETSLKVIKKESFEALDKKDRDSLHSSKKSSPKESQPKKDSLVLGAKDSVILRKTSLLRKSAEFSVVPKDSIELHRESKTEIKRKLSKLVTAKNSLEILRESKIIIGDLPSSIHQKDFPRQKSLIGGQVCPKSKCVDKCSQTKDVLSQMYDMAEERQSRKGSTDRSIKLSHIEIISVEGKEKDVGINETPIVYDSGTRTYKTDLTDVYKQPKKINKQKKKQPKKHKFLNLPSTVKVVGDQEATEHIESVDEFTENRIHSLIALIKDNPTLMRTFTACTR